MAKDGPKIGSERVRHRLAKSAWVGSGPPRGSKILETQSEVEIRRFEDPKLRVEVEEVEKRSSEDLTRR